MLDHKILLLVYKHDGTVENFGQFSPKLFKRYVKVILVSAKFEPKINFAYTAGKITDIFVVCSYKQD